MCPSLDFASLTGQSEARESLCFRVSLNYKINGLQWKMKAELCELLSLWDTMSCCAVLYRITVNSTKVTLALMTSLPPLGNKGKSP